MPRRAVLLLLLCATPICADPLNYYDLKLCFILDGFLGLFGLFMTVVFIREKFFSSKVKTEDGLYSSLRGQDPGYDQLRFGADSGARGARGRDDSLYTGLSRRGEDSEYRELPRPDQRHRNNEQLYQGLSAATRDTYDTLQQR